MFRCPNFPMCLFEYSRRTKCEFCPLCQVRLTHVSKRKLDLDVSVEPKSVKKTGMLNFSKTPKVVKIGKFRYSVYHHGYKRTCVTLADEDGKIHFCEHQNCILKRVSVIRGSTVQFECRHILLVLEAIKASDEATKDSFIKKGSYFKSVEILEAANNNTKLPGDTKCKIISFLSPSFLALKLSDDCYSITTPQNTKAKSGVLILSLPRQGNMLVCSAGSDCERVVVGVAKKTLRRLPCVHKEIIGLIDKKK